MTISNLAPPRFALPRDGLPICATRRIEPREMSPDQLDEYLAAGWYRIGQSMMYCDFVTMERDTTGVLWTRVPLEDYSFKRSLRRTRNKVERDFSVEVGPLTHDTEHELLYQRYLTTTSGTRAEDLCELRGVSSPNGADIFDTYEVSVRDGDRLIAFSWFDRGATSIQSITGVYDPDYASYSLGIYTMLRELRYGIDEGLTHFYAGYVLCGDSTMDYKLRTGHVWCLDRPAAQWRAWEEVEAEDLDPLQRTRDALLEARDGMREIRCALHVNDHFTLSAVAPNLTSCLAYHVALLCGPTFAGMVLALCWDSALEQYELLRCIRATLTSPQTRQVLVDELFVVSGSLGQYADIDSAVAAVRHELDGSLIH